VKSYQGLDEEKFNSKELSNIIDANQLPTIR
jgi:hypothetical protein